MVTISLSLISHSPGEATKNVKNTKSNASYWFVCSSYCNDLTSQWIRLSRRVDVTTRSEELPGHSEVCCCGLAFEVFG